MEGYEDHRLEERRLRFEANRHMSTLSVAVLVLMLALDQRMEDGAEFAGRGLLLFGISLFFSVVGMCSTFAMDWLFRIVGTPPGNWCFVISAFFFGLGVLTLILVPVLF